MAEICPFHTIEIPENREILKTDSLKFPWKEDPNGYFLVKIENDEIHCGFVNSSHKMEVEFIGKNPDKIIKEIAKRKLVNLEHMGYIAQEMQIALECLENNKNYIQR